MGRAAMLAPFDETLASTIEIPSHVRKWLITLAILVITMITVGGATRLTGSGLSITEWQPIMGAIPPLNEAAWLMAFAKYKEIPQYIQLNKGMSLGEFQAIFWWEWGHRFLGRLIGLAFAAPLAWFWLRGKIPASMRLPLLALFALGFLQGFIGWFMVKSGLADRTSVSQYRLALHLTMAFLLLAGLVALAVQTQSRPSLARGSGIRLRTGTQFQRLAAWGLAGLILTQVMAGAFVAGLKAGLTYNTWPLMDGRLIPAGLGTLEPWFLNLFENITTVQFNHRMLAYLIVAFVIWHGLSIIRSADDERLRQSAGLLIVAVGAQVALGIWTLIAVVPLPLALAHQGMAAILFVIAIRHLKLVEANASVARPPAFQAA